MWYIIAAVAAVLVVAVIVLRSQGTPPVTMFLAIERGILDLQQKALADVIPDQSGELRGFDERAAQNRTVTLKDTIRFVYTVERRGDDYLHLVSSQLKRPKPKKYQIECMLVVMLVLNRQLAEAGIKQEDVKFEIEESSLGTQYVGMVLNADQQAQFSSGVTVAA